MTDMHDTKEGMDHQTVEPNPIPMASGRTIGGPGGIFVEVDSKTPLPDRFRVDFDHELNSDHHIRNFQVRDSHSARPPIEISLGRHGNQDTQIAMELAALVTTYMNARHRMAHARDGEARTELTVVIDWRPKT